MDFENRREKEAIFLLQYKEWTLKKGDELGHQKLRNQADLV